MFEQKVMRLIPIFWVVIGLLLIPCSLYSQTDAQKEKQEERDELFKMSLEELMNIKITTAGKTAEMIRDIPASVVLITREEIERYGYSSLSEILENVPGLYPINDRAANGMVFGVRGYWTGYQRNFIVLVNNVDQADNWGMHHLQNINLPIEAIDRIEVVRGPMSIMYGGGAFFGAINIFTNMPSEEESESLVSGSIGSEKTKRTAFRFAYQENDLKLVFNAGFYDTYGPNENLSRMVTELNSLEGYGISEAHNNTTTDGRLEHNNVYFNFSGNYKGFFADVILNKSTREEYHFWPTFSDGLLNKKKHTNIAFGYEKALTKSVSLKASFKYYLSSYWREFDYFFTDYFGQEISEASKYEIEVYSIFTPSEKFNILTGFNFKEKDTVDKLDLRSPPYLLSTGIYTNNIRNIALYSQANYSPSEKFKLIAGIRFEKLNKYNLEYHNLESGYSLKSNYDIDKVEVVPRFALIYSLNEDNVVKFLYGKAVRFPAYMDVVQTKIIREDENLSSEYINTLELNYLSTISPKLSLNLSFFHNILDDLLITVLEFDGATWSPRQANAGKLVSTGLEFMIYAKPIDNFLLELSGTYQKTKDKRENLENPDYQNRRIEYSPNFLGYAKASFSLTPDITLALTGKYVGKMEPQWDVASGGRIGKKVDGYFTLDGNVRFNDLFGKGYYLNLRCSNLLDTKYLYPIFTSNSLWADKGTFGNRRTFLVGIGKRF